MPDAADLERDSATDLIRLPRFYAARNPGIVSHLIARAIPNRIVEYGGVRSMGGRHPARRPPAGRSRLVGVADRIADRFVDETGGEFLKAGEHVPS